MVETYGFLLAMALTMMLLQHSTSSQAPAAGYPLPPLDGKNSLREGVGVGHREPGGLNRARDSDTARPPVYITSPPPPIPPWG